ncbi:MAG: U32 family peptidase [Fibrobacterota bacterium]|nr:U32 family peptidase [Fibrobacterota bacterium]QQS05496.1 MAG: U32 family peptidase [Fibrobacterota bacterium]
MPAVNRPELLAPAGDWDCARAAIENGADAIYFGVELFNARMRANNFTLSDLPELMAFLHLRGAKGYLAFNTLVFPSEMALAERTLAQAIEAGVDAAIVQDVGICRLIRSISPDFPIHASTQMTISSPEGAKFARELGCSLAVLARENTLGEMAKIQESLASDPLPLEVFVHGALCVAYSGQCLTSEALGGRSANRGECAQACRMPYEMLRDGTQVDLGDRRYLLSPQDLCGVELLPQLVRLGIHSLKIEGRLKQPSYVASIVRTYREALDKICGIPLDAIASGQLLTPEVRYRVEMAFSRGIHTGWMAGIDNQTLVHGRYPKKRGVYLGRVEKVTGHEVGLKLEAPLRAGDGVVFDAGSPESREEGGRVWEVQPEGERSWLAFGEASVDLRKVHVGDRVWKTSDPTLEKEIKKTWDIQDPAFQRPVSARVTGRAGEPLVLELSDTHGRVARERTDIVLEVARKRALDAEYLRAQIGRLGGTPYELATLDCALEGELMVPVSALNDVRRRAVESLSRLRTKPLRWTISDAIPVQSKIDTSFLPVRPEESASRTSRSAVLSLPKGATGADPSNDPELVVLVRTEAQMEAAASAGVRTLYLELEFPKRYPELIARWRKIAPDAEIWAAPPRIAKAGEEWILRQVEAGDADGILARAWDHLSWFAGRTRLRGDFSLNVANGLTAEWFLERFGLEGLTCSYDLTAQQILDLAASADPSRLELTLHQHMPMFHMEHCVFCAFLSSGKDFRDCGRPCEKHEVRLRDHLGAAHPVKADAGCRNTVFNARAQTGADYFPQFTQAGIRRFRVEFLDEGPDEVHRTLDRYRRLLAGEIDGRGLWKELGALGQLGVTRGTLER